MRRAIIHIGTKKTGSTSIQGFLARQRRHLAAQGACYPRSPGPIVHVKLHGLLARRRSAAKPGLDAESVDSSKLSDFPRAFAREMQNLPPTVDRVILSEERLSLLRLEDEIAELKALLQPHFDEFTIVVYLRSQASYMASRYSEQLRLCSFEGPDHIVSTPERLWPYDYRALTDRWAAVFGATAVTPRIYERTGGKNFDSVADFLGVCGLSLNVSDDAPAPVRNTSMSFAGQKLMLQLADLIKAQAGDGRVRYDLWRVISAAITAGVPGSGWLPTQAEAAAFMARFEESNEAVRRRYFPDRPSLFADDSQRFPLAPQEADNAAILDAACHSLIACAEKLEKRPRRTPAERVAGPLAREARRAARQRDRQHLPEG